MAQRNRVNPTRRLDQASHPSAWDAWCSPKPANEVEFPPAKPVPVVDMLAQHDQLRPWHRLSLIKLSEQPVGRRTIRASLGCEQLQEDWDPGAAFVGSGGYRCRGVQDEEPGRQADFSHGVLSNN